MMRSNPANNTAISRHAIAALLLAGTVLASTAADATTYRIVQLSLPSPGTADTISIEDINAAGAMVGSAYSSTGYAARAVAWSGPPDYTPRWLPAPNTALSYAKGVNDNGVIVGNVLFSPFNLSHYHAVMWGPNDVPVLLRNPPDMQGFSKANDINNIGVAIGYIQTKGSEDQAPSFWLGPENPQAFGNLDGDPIGVWLSAVNDSGAAVGYSFVAGSVNGAHAFRWTPEGGMETLQEPPGRDAWSSYAYDVNEAGQAVGKIHNNINYVDRAVMWDVDGSVLDLGRPSGPGLAQGNLALKINNAGEVIGSYWNGSITQGTRWTAATGMQRIVDLIDPLDPLYPWIVSGTIRVYAINDAGVIAGVVSVDGSQTAIVLVPQP